MARPTWFQRFLLPGFAFKAVVIGGGYATGRELAEFFVSVGPRGGLLAMALSTVLFSLICVVTFLFARMHGSTDYRNFFRNLVGPFWVVYEAAYMFSFILILAVYGAAAGAIGVAMFGWPPLAGVMCLIGSIAAFTMFGNASVEWLFKYASFFLYGVYALFVFFTLRRFGAEALQGLAVPAANDGWVTRRSHVHGLQRPRRRGHPAGPASPDQHAGRRHCGPARGTPHDDRGRAFLRVHDGLVPGDRRGGPAGRLHVAPARHAAAARGFPADDLPGPAAERGQLRACDQRAHRGLHRRA